MSSTNKVWEVMNDLEMVTSKVCSAREMIDVVVEAIQSHDYDRAESMANAAYEFLGYYLEEFDAKFKLAWKETVVNKKEVDDGMRPWGHSDIEYQIANRKESLTCDKDDPSPECQGAWNDFWSGETLIKADGYSVNGEGHSEYYYDYNRNDINRKNPFGGLIYESPDNGKTIYSKQSGEIKKTLVKEDKVKKWVLPVEQIHDEYFVSFPDDLLEASNLKEGDVVEWVDKGDGSYLLRKVTRPLVMDEC